MCTYGTGKVDLRCTDRYLALGTIACHALESYVMLSPRDAFGLDLRFAAHGTNRRRNSEPESKVLSLRLGFRLCSTPTSLLKAEV